MYIFEGQFLIVLMGSLCLSIVLANQGLIVVYKLLHPSLTLNLFLIWTPTNVTSQLTILNDDLTTYVKPQPTIIGENRTCEVPNNNFMWKYKLCDVIILCKNHYSLWSPEQPLFVMTNLYDVKNKPFSEINPCEVPKKHFLWRPTYVKFQQPGPVRHKQL